MEQFVLENTLGVCSVEEDKLVLKWINLIQDVSFDNDPNILDNDMMSRSTSILTKNVKNRLYGRDVFSGTVDAVTGEPCHGRRIYSHTQEVYEGPFRNGKRHGSGAVCTRLDGTSKFLGSFHDDFMHEGCLVTDERTYNGFFHENQFHGKGVLIHAEGSIFEGAFVNGEYDHGTLTTEDWTYVGSFGPNNQRHGPGLLTHKKGDVYEGDFKDNKKHGIGVETRANGFVHHGNWENDLPNGHGTLRTEHVELTGYWKDGQTTDGPGWTIKYPKLDAIYEGEAKGGRPHGAGMLTISSNESVTKYTGEFCVGLRHGVGTLLLGSEVVYSGTWIGDEPMGQASKCDESQHKKPSSPLDEATVIGQQPHDDEPEFEPNQSDLCLKVTSRSFQPKGLYGEEGGERDSQPKEMGKINFPHVGATYIGMLVNGKMEGRGSMYFADGSEYKGMFQNGIINGSGKLRDAINNSAYQGQFVQGEKHGCGKETQSDGTYYEGEFKHNQRNGEGKLYQRTQGQKKKKVLIYDGEFSDGVRHGKGERFGCTYPCKGSYLGEFTSGRQEGHGVFTTETGISYEGEWSDGTPLDGDWVITEPNGVVYYGSAVCSPIADGLPVPEGFGSQKSKQGDFYTGSWVNGKRHGTGMCVFGTGEQWDGRWRNDVFVKFGRSSPYQNSI